MSMIADEYTPEYSATDAELTNQTRALAAMARQAAVARDETLIVASVASHAAREAEQRHRLTERQWQLFLSLLETAVQLDPDIAAELDLATLPLPPWRGGLEEPYRHLHELKRRAEQEAARAAQPRNAVEEAA